MSPDRPVPSEVLAAAKVIQQKEQPERNREIHELDAELVDAVEKSTFMIGDKIDFLLTKAGFKPATRMELPKEFFTSSDLQNVVDVIKQSGMFLQTEEDNTPTQELTVIYIANKKSDLDVLVTAWNANDLETVGKIVGYPQTAVEAYVGKREKWSREQIPTEILESDAMAFLTPTLSQEHWQTEMEEGEKRAKFLKKYAPRIYEAAVQDRKRHRMIEQNKKEII